jgi:hypothetical protein
MKKIFLIFALTILFFNKGYAATGEGVATEYVVTMQKLELCEDSACAASTTVGDSSMGVDIASVSAGADIGTYAATTGLPLGTTFSHLRVTISRTFTVTGSVTAGSTACVTDGGTDNTATNLLDAATGTAVSTSMYLVNAATYDASDGSTGGSDIEMSYGSPTYATTMTISGGSMIMIYELTSPYTVGLRAPTIKVIFNTDTALGATDDACVMWLQEPFCQITIQ